MTVFLADDEDVACALRMDGYPRELDARRSRSASITRAGTTRPIYIDADFLLGPEAAHLTVTGVSGLATKTSAVEWLLASIFAHFPAAKGSVAAVCFNVKGPDLCFLDQPATRSRPTPTERSTSSSACRRSRSRAFEYFAPYTARWVHAQHAAVARGAGAQRDPARWGLREVMQYADVLLNA